MDRHFKFLVEGVRIRNGNGIEACIEISGDVRDIVMVLAKNVHSTQAQEVGDIIITAAFMRLANMDKDLPEVLELVTEIYNKAKETDKKKEASNG